MQGLLRIAGKVRGEFKGGMNPDELKALKDVTALSLPLQALWWDARGEWERAHEVCQQARSREGDRVHAYLHRKEGDEVNAGYWYARAGTARPAEGMSLETEWAELAAELSGER